MPVCGLLSKMYKKLVKIQRDNCHGRYKEEILSRGQFPCLHYLHIIMKLISSCRMSEWNPELRRKSVIFNCKITVYVDPLRSWGL